MRKWVKDEKDGPICTVSKTNWMTVGSNYNMINDNIPVLNFQMNITINQVSETELLGLKVDNKLWWNKKTSLKWLQRWVDVYGIN